MSKWFRRLSAFWLALIPGLLGILIILLVFDKGSGFLSMQLPHSKNTNLLFGLLTFPGDGLFAVGLVILLLLLNTYRNALTLLTGYVTGGLLVQCCKMVIFTPTPRPVKWFELNHYPFTLPEGLNPHFWHSFPSGHSASAATLFLFLAALTDRKPIQFICGVCALLVGYSRIYLYMHFPEDVFVGLLVGALSMIASHIWLDRWFDKKQPSWADKNILKR